MYGTIVAALTAIRRGELVIVSDDGDRENEGDLVMAAEHVTPAAVNFMITHGRGLLCAPVTAARAAVLGLSRLGGEGDRFGTAFTESVDAREGVTTGISAHDRAHTIHLLADPGAGRDRFVVPGHVFPLIAHDGGVLVRPGHTEAAVDLARLAGCQPAGVICEIMNADGGMARQEDLARFAAVHGLLAVRIADLIAHRREHEPALHASGSVSLPTGYGPVPFTLHCFVAESDAKEHLALTYGDFAGDPPPVVRVHSECLTGDIFHSARCDCGDQLDHAMREIVREGRGILVYLRQEGRGIGLVNKLRAYSLQEQGLDTVEANERLGFPADARDYQVAAEILRRLGVSRVRLLTNNPRKVAGLQRAGIEVAARLPLVIPPGDSNRRYLHTKKERLGHLL